MIPTWPFGNRYHNLFPALGLDPDFRVRGVGALSTNDPGIEPFIMKTADEPGRLFF